MNSGTKCLPTRKWAGTTFLEKLFYSKETDEVVPVLKVEKNRRNRRAGGRNVVLRFPLDNTDLTLAPQCRRHEKMVAGCEVRNERNARNSKSQISFSPGGATEPFHLFSRTPPGCREWWVHRVPVVSPPATILRPSGTKTVIRHVFHQSFIEGQSFVLVQSGDESPHSKVFANIRLFFFFTHILRKFRLHRTKNKPLDRQAFPLTVFQSTIFAG